MHAFARRDYAAALDSFRAILAERPWFADIRNYAGLCLGFLGRTEEALEQLELALEVNASYVEAHINRALLLQELGRYEDAQEAVERAAAYEQPASGRLPAAAAAQLANAHAGIGDMYADADLLEEAAAQYRVALHLRPGFLDIRNKLGMTLVGLGRIDAAAAEFAAALESNPRFTAARLNLGLALYRQGRVAEAAAEWALCEEHEPGHAQARAYLAMLRQANPEAGTD